MKTPLLVPLTGLLLSLSACKPAPTVVQTPPPQVSVTQTVEKDVHLWNEYIARTAAVESVEIRARVGGHLEEIRFEDGADVKKGDVLFVIDQRTYQNDVDLRKADLERSKAASANAKADYDRAAKAVAMKAISQEEYERKAAIYAESQATIAANEAALADAELKLSFAEVRSPIDGTASRHLISVGNVISADITPLTTITSTNPVYAYFDIEENQLLQYQRLFADNKDFDPRKVEIPAALALSDETDFPHTGKIDFIDTVINPGTASLQVRAIFDNKTGKLVPGMFARVRINSGLGGQRVVIPPRAVTSNQSDKVVYVVGKDNIVESRKVELGPVEDGQRVIMSGLKPGETIIVDGLLYARPGAPVTPHALGSTGAAGTPAASPAAPAKEEAAKQDAPKAAAENAQ